MKTLILSLLLAAAAQASQLGDIRQAVAKTYASYPIGAEDMALAWNRMVFRVVAGGKHEPLSPLKDYEKQTMLADDPSTGIVKPVKILLNDLKPILILRSLAKHRPEKKPTRSPLVRTVLRTPRINTPPSATR